MDKKKRRLLQHQSHNACLFQVPNCNLCKNNVVIDCETASEIKRALTANITKEYKYELMENKALANDTCDIMGLPRDTVHQPDNISDKICGEAVIICV